MPAVIIGMSLVMVGIIIVVPPSTHFRRCNGTFGTRHGFEHPLQRVTIQTHSAFSVHILSAFRFVSSVGNTVVKHIVVVS